MKSKGFEKKVEVILGFILGIPAILVGVRLIAGSCNLIFPTPQVIPAAKKADRTFSLS